MKLGEPFNPYRVFQGAFAPFWLLEHSGLGAGAKLCYIRLLGFAGKDGRCYPSLQTLGTGLGVSERQARDYVKELERVGLIAIEQRGLRKTNVYLFVWTVELEKLVNSVPEAPVDPEDQDGPISKATSTVRNSRSGLDRKGNSGLARNSSSGQDRKPASGPIGISSPGMSSQESSSSSSADQVGLEALRTKTKTVQEPVLAGGSACVDLEETNRTAETVMRWARDRTVQRLRSNGSIGLPEKDLLAQWSGILKGFGIVDADRIIAVLDRARTAADGVGQWRSWSFLTLQIQLAAERLRAQQAAPQLAAPEPPDRLPEDSNSEWAQVKAVIRTLVGEIAFANWFEQSRQTECGGSAVTITVPDHPTRAFLENDYRELIKEVASSLGIDAVRFVVNVAR